MPKKYFYIESTSALLDPEGNFIKYVFCPKANEWNQLLHPNVNDSSWKCNICDDEVINLDNISVDQSTAMLRNNSNLCVYASEESKNVIFLKDQSAHSSPMTSGLMPARPINPDGLPELRVSTDIEVINGAADIGYWPDAVEIVPTEETTNKYVQNTITGKISLLSDARLNDRPLKKVINVLTDYTNYDLAAYLIPPQQKDNARVFIRRVISLPVNHNLLKIPPLCSAEGLIQNNTIGINLESLIPHNWLIG